VTVLKDVTRCSDVAVIVKNMTEQFMVASDDINANTFDTFSQFSVLHIDMLIHTVDCRTAF